MTGTDVKKKSPILTLDRETLVPIGLLVAVVLSATGATVWINTALLNLVHSVEKANDQIAAMDIRITAMQAQMQNGSRETWTLADMRRWIELANARNPAANLPDPGSR